ncbi:hypothetical protein BpHYR1_040977 [Brachionus plicatilis]|uniref:Uncharacterized protein n=1 Tax=Brachionus plicatilis TaxID=10195 RepID=A0A3M7P301_BRAPC|nr:hypothetical protein BpHYR1_040977 [Brachionus plicatilis]
MVCKNQTAIIARNIASFSVEKSQKFAVEFNLLKAKSFESGWNFFVDQISRLDLKLVLSKKSNQFQVTLFGSNFIYFTLTCHCEISYKTSNTKIRKFHNFCSNGQKVVLQMKDTDFADFRRRKFCMKFHNAL